MWQHTQNNKNESLISSGVWERSVCLQALLLAVSKCEIKRAINLPSCSGLWERPDSSGLSDTWTLSRQDDDLMEGWMDGWQKDTCTHKSTSPGQEGVCGKVGKRKTLRLLRTQHVYCVGDWLGLLGFVQCNFQCWAAAALQVTQLLV